MPERPRSSTVKSEAVRCEVSTSRAVRDWLCLRKQRRTRRMRIERRSEVVHR